MTINKDNHVCLIREYDTDERMKAYKDGYTVELTIEEFNDSQFKDYFKVFTKNEKSIIGRLEFPKEDWHNLF